MADVEALVQAARQGDEEALRLLLTQGANIHDKNNDGCTALMLAAAQGHMEVARLLDPIAYLPINRNIQL